MQKSKIFLNEILFPSVTEGVLVAELHDQRIKQNKKPKKKAYHSFLQSLA